jgi:hypothetical protein
MNEIADVRAATEEVNRSKVKLTKNINTEFRGIVALCKL